MATYYVRTGGSNGAAGTSAGAAWATIGKALGASGISSGDTVYIGAGVYRETVAVAMTSAVAETKIIADVDGSQTGDAGEVIWTAYTTDDKTTPSTSATLDLAGRSFLTFQDMTIVGGNLASDGTAVLSATTTATNITFRRCVISGAAAAALATVYVLAGANVALAWTIDSCVIDGFSGNGVLFTLTRPTGADFNVNVTVKNSMIRHANGSGYALQVNTTGANTFKPGGVLIYNCVITGYICVYLPVATLSTSTPCKIRNSIVVGAYALYSNASNQLTEQYNFLSGSSAARNNIGSGTGTQVAPNYAPMLDLGNSWLHGLAPRPYFTPLAGSPLLGFGDDGVLTTATDALNRPRPAGGNSTSKGVGYLERHDTAIKETGTTDAGSVAINITGPGDHDFRIPVDAVSTTISVKARYDSTHAATNKPQAILLDAPEIGVTTQTLTMSAAVDTWETLTFSSITPSAKGVVIVRLVSRAAAANGKAFFDSFVVS